MKLSKIASLMVLAFLAAASLTPAAGGEGGEGQIRVYYDRTQPAALLWDYRFRVLVLEDVEEVGRCFHELPNGTVQTICRPVAGAVVRIIYEDLKEAVDVETDASGVAEARFRLWSFPTATFNVSVLGAEYRFVVETAPWPLLSSLAFTALLSALLYAVRRGSW